MAYDNRRSNGDYGRKSTLIKLLILQRRLHNL